MVIIAICRSHPDLALGLQTSPVGVLQTGPSKSYRPKLFCCPLFGLPSASSILVSRRTRARRRQAAGESAGAREASGQGIPGRRGSAVRATVYQIRTRSEVTPINPTISQIFLCFDTFNFFPSFWKGNCIFTAV